LQGDIVYLDDKVIWKWRIPADAGKVQRVFHAQRNLPAYAEFAERFPITGIYDDHGELHGFSCDTNVALFCPASPGATHGPTRNFTRPLSRTPFGADLGQNDADRTWDRSVTEVARQSLFEFLDEPADSARRRRQGGGVYGHFMLGSAPRRVRLILLDVRTFRDPWFEDRPSDDPRLQQDLLGQAQWAWLESVLRDPGTAAEVTLIANGLQIIGRNDPWVGELWGKAPESQARLLALLAATNTSGAFLLSGDVHVAEVNRLACAGLGYPLYEFTASGLTHSWGGWLIGSVWRAIVMGHTRVPGGLYQERHWGEVRFDWGEVAVPVDPATGRCPPDSVPAAEFAARFPNATLAATAAQCVANNPESSTVEFRVHGVADGRVHVQQAVRLSTVRPRGGAGLRRLEHAGLAGERAVKTACARLKAGAAVAHSGVNYSVVTGPEREAEFDVALRDYACSPQELESPDDTGYPLLTNAERIQREDLQRELGAAIRACAASSLQAGSSPECRRFMHTCSPKLTLGDAMYYFVGHGIVLAALWGVVGSGFALAAVSLWKGNAWPGGRSVWVPVGIAIVAAVFGLIRVLV